jgi:hypothetical protein
MIRRRFDGLLRWGEKREIDGRREKEENALSKT